jgi:hypothetical protein
MSCLGPNYFISTTNPWYRRQTRCTDATDYIANNLNPNDTIYIPILKKTVLVTKIADAFKMYRKGNILQYAYIHHSNKLTKNQKYALIAQGKGTSKKKRLCHANRKLY